MNNDKRLPPSKKLLAGKSGVADSRHERVTRPGGSGLVEGVVAQDDSKDLLRLKLLLRERQAPTQGNRKALQKLDELWQNEAFRAEFSEIRHMQASTEKDKRLFKFAEDHRLDISEGALYLQFFFDQKPEFQDPHLDLCKILDEVEDNFGDLARWNYEAPPRPNRRKRLSIALYPIHIGISPLASERDVLDFVKKRWPVIRKCLDIYQEKPPVIRQKRKAARDKFIWENREVPSQELAEMVNSRFPGESLVYYQVDSIKHYMKERNS